MGQGHTLEAMGHPMELPKKKIKKKLTLQPLLLQDPAFSVETTSAHNQLVALSCQMNHFIKFPGLTLSAGRERRAEPGQERAAPPL